MHLFCSKDNDSVCHGANGDYVCMYVCMFVVMVVERVEQRIFWWKIMYFWGTGKKYDGRSYRFSYGSSRRSGDGDGACDGDGDGGGITYAI